MTIVTKAKKCNVKVGDVLIQYDATNDDGSLPLAFVIGVDTHIVTYITQDLEVHRWFRSEMSKHYQILEIERRGI